MGLRKTASGSAGLGQPPAFVAPQPGDGLARTAAAVQAAPAPQGAPAKTVMVRRGGGGGGRAAPVAAGGAPTIAGVEYICPDISDAEADADLEWADDPYEEAQMHTYHVDPRDPVGNGQWKKHPRFIQVCVQKKRFAEGGLRDVYRMRVRNTTTRMWTELVAKKFKNEVSRRAITTMC